MPSRLEIGGPGYAQGIHLTCPCRRLEIGGSRYFQGIHLTCPASGDWDMGFWACQGDLPNMSRRLEAWVSIRGSGQAQGIYLTCPDGWRFSVNAKTQWPFSYVISAPDNMRISVKYACKNKKTH